MDKTLSDGWEWIKEDRESTRKWIEEDRESTRKAAAEEILKAWGESNGDFNKWLEMKKTFNVV